MHFRFATVSDAELLARMNQQLIRDEGHRNRMTLPELASRMVGWLQSEYQAVLFEDGGLALGYALYKREPEHIYLRQFFIESAHRRKGVGSQAMNWLAAHAWNGTRRLRLDVLVGNASGIAFWRANGFNEYCLTMEKDIA